MQEDNHGRTREFCSRGGCERPLKRVLGRYCVLLKALVSNHVHPPKVCITSTNAKLCCRYFPKCIWLRALHTRQLSMRSCHCRFILSAHYQRLDKVAIRGEKLLRCQGPNKEEGPRKKHTHTHTHTLLGTFLNDVRAGNGVSMRFGRKCS